MVYCKFFVKCKGKPRIFEAWLAPTKLPELHKWFLLNGRMAKPYEINFGVVNGQTNVQIKVETLEAQ